MTDPEHAEIDRLRHRLGQLIERAHVGDDSGELASEALEELAVVVEELQSQNTELVASRRTMNEQRQRYRDLFDAVADGYLITDAAGMVREANRLACDLLDVDRGRAIGQPLATFVDPADRSALYLLLSRIREADVGDHLAIDLTVRDDEEIPANLRATRSTPDDRGDLRITWLLRDRRHDLSSEELRASEERLRALFESVPVGVALCDVDGDLLYVNSCATTILDRSRDDTARDGWLSTVHADDRATVEAAIDRACGGSEVRGLRHRTVHRDGNEMWVDHSISPFRVDGAVTGFVSTIVDVTSEHMAMTQLGASHDFTDALLDTAGALIVVVDADGAIMRFNKTCETVTGFPASEVVGRRLVDTLVPDDDRAAVAEFLDELLRERAHSEAGPAEADWLTATGDRRRIEWAYTTLAGADGVVLVGTGIDVTERRLLETRLAQADRLDSIGRLTAGVAHDFNNTLTTLRLRIDRIAGRDLDDDSRADVAGAVATIERTQRLIGDLLSFSRRGPSDPVAVRIDDETRRVVAVLADLLSDRLVIETDLASGDSVVTIDPTRLEQGLTNLAINARDAMPEGGTLTISTRTDTIGTIAATDPRKPVQLAGGDYVVLSVADTGTGIEPDAVAHIFEPYFTTKPPGRGTGLGLATTYGTVAQSGGAILVDTSPGQGTTFEVWLPVADVATGASATRDRPDGGSAVLVVDDDDDLRQALVDELTRLGYRTTQAPDAGSALEQLDRPVDVLLCDVQLPDLDGTEVATRFRRRHPDLEVVYISGAPGSRLDELLPAGSTVVPKPFNIDTVLGVIRNRPDGG